MKGYEDLLVWQHSIDLVPKIYELTRTFPRTEIYALSNQIRRAVVSIPANIAEGQARRHRKEFLQYLMISKGSLAELHTLLIVAERLRYVSSDQLAAAVFELVEIRRMLAGLTTSLR
ncbi:MAG TPA: four helix bundle protein [Thermoanaerobaculia bacterium]|nr:four helix bundle protein [Thermoanaerobaculia bacterium]